MEAQGYFRVVRPIASEQKMLSATLLPFSVSPELDAPVSGQRPRNLVVGTDGKTPIAYPFSADHSIFFLAFDNLDHFSEDVNHFAKTIFDPSVQVMIDSKELDYIKQYWEQGFRYFAFDVSHLGKSPSRKTAIAYRFQSMSAFYPLAIGAIGGTVISSKRYSGAGIGWNNWEP